jgi:hypothetical protein
MSSLKSEIKIYTCTILPVVLYESETLSLKLRGKHRSRVFENSVLRRIFGFKMEEVARGRRRLHSEEHHNLYASPNSIQNVHRKPPERPKHR